MKSISRSAGRRAAKTGWILIAMGTVFLLAGGAFVYFLAILPIVRVQQAKAWIATPCEILSSEVETHRGDDGDTYRVAITYRYRVDGQTYTGDRYQFVPGSSSGRSGKAKIVRQYPAGSAATCYVNPADPAEAVIERRYTRDMLFGLIPLVFVFAGAGMMVGGVVTLRRRSAEAGAERQRGGSASAAPAHEPPGPVTLEAGNARLGKLLGVALFAVIWNGISWFGMVMVWRDESWIGIAFLSLFVLIGAAAFVGVGYVALAMFNPTVRLTINRRDVPLGETLRIQWQLIGRPGRLKAFRLTLEATEKATYQRGTDTVTDTHVFRVVQIAHVTDRRTLITARDDAQVVIPSDSMHSFEASRNEIVWQLRAHGEIARWPDVNDTWPLTVLPQSPT